MEESRERHFFGLTEAGYGMLRFALLFGSAAVALALIVAPIAERETRTMARSGIGIDMTTTGSIGYRGTYTERRSILQKMPDSLCVIRDNGSRSGDC